MARRTDNPDKEYDRKARLIFVLHLLNCNTRGLTLEAIAGHCGVTTRTVRRDFHGLEAEFGAKFAKEGSRYILLPGTVLPPVLFTEPEAMAIFMAARLLLQQSSVYNQHIETTFTKLSSIVRPPLRDEIMKTLQWMKRHRPDGATVKMLGIISQCWNERRQARIRYWPLNARTSEVRIIEPYFIQPSALEHAVYVIAQCRLRNDLRVFRLDRMLEAQALASTYTIPEAFDANEYLNAYWSITATGEPRTVRLRFRPEVARIARETVWHDSQVTESQMDGSAIVTMKLALTRDLVSFILGWSDMVEVMAPRMLRVEVARAARKVHDMYGEREAPALPGLPRYIPGPTVVPSASAGSSTQVHAGVPPLAQEPEGLQLGLFPNFSNVNQSAATPHLE
ncbi:MAG: WYL domain-containing protein [Dehalococcoidia bacterium]|nr:MAG: WYL domain-containing protein [Dehalococcoidia bacterium]